MKTRIIVSAVLLPVFFAVLFILPPIFLTIIVSAICGVAAFELLHATKISKHKRVLVYTIITAAFVPFAVYFGAIPTMAENAIRIDEGLTPVIHMNIASTFFLITLLLSIFFIFICLLIIEAALAFRSKKAIEKGTQLKFRQIPIALAAGILIPYMLSALISLKCLPYGHLFVLLPIVSAFMTDSGAYFIGVAFGKTKPFPTISPNKTIEGYIGGLIIGTLGMVIYGVIITSTTTLNVILPVIIIYGILGAIVTELGDLAFSLIKRKCGIKDYGKLIPGHGGALDRFDSMSFCAPTMYLLTLTLPAIIV